MPDSATRHDCPLFVLQGNGSLLNLGCDAILRSTVDLLRAEFGPCRIVHSPVSTYRDRVAEERDPDVTHDVPRPIPRFGLSRFTRLFRRIVLRQTAAHFEHHVRAAVATLAIGGDNYSLYYGIPTGFFQDNEVTLRLKKPLFLWGASVGPFTKEPAFERFAANALRRVTIICARETETVAYLESIGVRDNVRLVADPAFTLEAAAPKRCDVPDEALKGNAIGLNFSPLLAKYRTTGRTWDEEAAECVDAVLRRIDAPVVLVPHVVAPHTDDRAFMERVRQRLPQHAGRLHLAALDYDCREIKWIIARMKAFAGARTHATIAAMSSGVPTLSIGYSIKARGINRDLFGHENWLIPADQLVPEAFAERIAQLIAADNDVRSYLAKALPAYKERVRSAVKFVREHTGL